MRIADDGGWLVYQGELTDRDRDRMRKQQAPINPAHRFIGWAATKANAITIAEGDER